MDDKKHVKVQGIRFARSLQTLVKMVNMFSADHKSASGLLQRSYDLLNPLVKQARHLTIGFVDQRVLLNNILTAEESLKPLENEFLKRGIGAVTFEAGITLAAYRTAVGAISAAPKLIEECGGLLPFLEQRQLEFVRVFPANKTETRNEDGDTVLDMGSEEYLISKALSSMNSGLPRGIESLLTQMEAAGSGGGGGGVYGGGYGTGEGGRDGGSGNGSSGAGHESVNHGSGASRGGVAVYAGGGTSSSGGYNGYLMEMQRVVEQKFEASLSNPEEDPHKAYVELAKMLRNVRPDFVVSNLMAGTAVAESNQEEVTAEVFEDTALRWALRRLSATPSGEEAVIVEEQVFRVLMRSLQATHSAARLAQKLAQYAQEYALPRQTMERIQEEIRWITLAPKQKLRELLAVTHFTPAQFRRCLELIKELTRLGKPEDAVALGVQYFSIFDDYLALEMTEVGRIPELLRCLAGTQGEFWQYAADMLVQALASRKVNQLVHVQVVNALVTLAKIAATYEDFELVLRVGAALEESAGGQTAHKVCCDAGISSLVQPSAVDRIAEIYLDKKNDPAWVRTVSSILRWAGSSAIERLFVALDKEMVAVNRLALIRLLGRIGQTGLPAARERLKHKDWYVVRNACKLLGELKDPQLLEYVAPVLEHHDERVQKAALRAVMECKLPRRAAVIANALPLLPPELLEDALCELMHQADVEILPGLESFFNSCSAKSGRVPRQVINVIAAVPREQAVNLLSRISYNEAVDASLRRAAQEALSLWSARKANRSVGEERCGIDFSHRWATLTRTS
jgi:HEAT repeat protein